MSKTRIRTEIRGRELRAAQPRQNAQAQSEAIERLIALLEAATPEQGDVHFSGATSNDRLSQMARLRMARAAYALATNGTLERVAPGAWLRH